MVEHVGPELWRSLLAILPAGSIIAGGAIRDHFLGLTPLDGSPFSGVSLVDTFDFGITRGWFDETGLHDTREAKADRRRATVTICLADRIQRSIARFDRFNARMGGIYRLVPASREIAVALKGAGR